MLLREERTLLTGDACNTFTFLFDDYSEHLTAYEKNLKELKRKTEGKFDRVYLSHGESPLPKELLDGVLQVCEDIKNKNTDDVPFQFMGKTAFIAKAVTREMNRVDGGLGNIVYSPDRIW